MFSFNRLLVIVVILVFSLILPAAGQSKNKDPQGQQEVFKFLKMIDKGDYAASYELTSTYFKGVLSQAKWVESLNGARRPLGSLVSRHITESERHTSLPGAPDGLYLVFTLKSSFQHKKTATETVTLQQEKDGSLKVAGYYIR
ncbi:MAG: hypothetical protein BZ151_08605 [Desulfobacca sp. 4484_104]|nr:MAG: hypothetical protein BZ151_08605 [Desulfobacca sp. 4484_104]RLA90475.1 MAG: hypothetical protein DRG58_02020 [Deltaproteobacteria bacterium]